VIVTHGELLCEARTIRSPQSNARRRNPPAIDRYRRLCRRSFRRRCSCSSAISRSWRALLGEALHMELPTYTEARIEAAEPDRRAACGVSRRPVDTEPIRRGSNASSCRMTATAQHRMAPKRSVRASPSTISASRSSAAWISPLLGRSLGRKRICLAPATPKRRLTAMRLASVTQAFCASAFATGTSAASAPSRQSRKPAGHLVCALPVLVPRGALQVRS
jgi:hypothetical protein